MRQGKRLDRLEMPKGKCSRVQWPDVFHYPEDGTRDEQAAFTRNIERRRLARQQCFVVGGEGGYASEDDAFSALCECFVG